MSLAAKIAADLKTAMKEGDRQRTGVLRMLTAALKNERIDKRRELEDEDVLSVFTREVKRRKEAAQQYRAGNAPDRADAEEKEAEIISAYLPEGLSEAEVDRAIREVVEEVGARTKKDLGRVMGVLMSRYRGRIDGKVAQQRVSALLD